MDERFNHAEYMAGEWKGIFVEAYRLSVKKTDKVTEDMRVSYIVKSFVNTLWNTKELLKSKFKKGYLPVDCIGIINNMHLFVAWNYDCPKKVEACRIIARRFVERIVCNEKHMFSDEIGIFTEKTETPVYFYNIKDGDISEVLTMLDELEEN